MKYLRICAFLALLCVQLFSVSAKEYLIETGNDDIVCTVKKYTQSQMLQLFTSHLGNYKFEGISSESTACMGVKLVIENRSQATIAIEPEEFLESMGNAFLAKKIFLHKFIKLIHDYTESTTEEFIGGGLLALMGLMCGAPVIAEAIRDRNLVARLLWSGLGAFISLLVAAPGLQLIYTGFSQKTKNTFLQKQATQVKKYIAHSTRLKQLTGDLKETIIAPNVETYFIPPEHALQHLFFIDLTQAQRDFFEYANPKLIYEEVAA